MSSYYLRKRPQADGTYTVHKEGCPFMPDINNRIYIGKHVSGLEALKYAGLYFSETSGCRFCIMESKQIKVPINNDCLKIKCGFCIFNNSDYN